MPTIERVSVATDGTQGTSASWDAEISGDGRYVVFHSVNSNLVAGDTNGQSDIFVHDRVTGVTERVSEDAAGTIGTVWTDGWSADPSVSADGRFVVFDSDAENLVVGDNNGTYDVFVHDRQTGLTEIVSVASDNTQGNHVSWDADISADGRYVVFQSLADNLVAGDNNDTWDIFVHDRVTGVTELASVNSKGKQGDFASWDSAISGDGRFVVFESKATNLADDPDFQADLYLHDRMTGKTELVSATTDGSRVDNEPGLAALSGDGRFTVYWSRVDDLVQGDTNNSADIFVFDRVTGATDLVSVATDGTQANRDSWEGASLSGNGRFVVFVSEASNLVAGDTNGQVDVFVHDRSTGVTERVSVAFDGAQANSGSWDSAISYDGRVITFESSASNLVAGDTNGTGDVFVVDNPLFDDALFTDGADVVTLFTPGTYRALAGDDRVTGTESDDRISGNAGRDVLIGNGGNDRLFGNIGQDRLLGGKGSDRLVGGDGNDRLFGNRGKDLLEGGKGGDRLVGGDGNDRLSGNKGNDFLDGGKGDDRLDGGNGNDRLLGKLGKDFLDGGKGADKLFGGGGNDVFVFRDGYGRDRIADFADDVDTLRLDDSLWTGTRGVAQVIADFADVVGDDVVFDFGGDILTLKGFGAIGPNALMDDITII